MRQTQRATGQSPCSTSFGSASSTCSGRRPSATCPPSRLGSWASGDSANRWMPARCCARSSRRLRNGACLWWWRRWTWSRPSTTSAITPSRYYFGSTSVPRTSATLGCASRRIARARSRPTAPPACPSSERKLCRKVEAPARTSSMPCSTPRWPSWSLHGRQKKSLWSGLTARPWLASWSGPTMSGCMRTVGLSWSTARVPSTRLSPSWACVLERPALKSFAALTRQRAPVLCSATAFLKKSVSCPCWASLWTKADEASPLPAIDEKSPRESCLRNLLFSRAHSCRQPRELALLMRVLFLRFYMGQAVGDFRQQSQMSALGLRGLLRGTACALGKGRPRAFWILARGPTPPIARPGPDSALSPFLIFWFGGTSGGAATWPARPRPILFFQTFGFGATPCGGRWHRPPPPATARGFAIESSLGAKPQSFAWPRIFGADWRALAAIPMYGASTWEGSKEDSGSPLDSPSGLLGLHVGVSSLFWPMCHFYTRHATILTWAQAPLPHNTPV